MERNAALLNGTNLVRKFHISPLQTPHRLTYSYFSWQRMRPFPTGCSISETFWRAYIAGQSSTGLIEKQFRVNRSQVKPSQAKRRNPKKCPVECRLERFHNFCQFEVVFRRGEQKTFVLPPRPPHFVPHEFGTLLASRSLACIS